jgi:hypothetical protein
VASRRTCPSAGWTDAQPLSPQSGAAPQIEDFIFGNEIFLAGIKGVRVLSPELVGNGVMRVATRAEADALGTACRRPRLVRADGFVADNTRSMQQFPPWISPPWISQKKLLAAGGHCSSSPGPGGAAPASSLALWDASASTSRSPR